VPDVAAGHHASVRTGVPGDNPRPSVYGSRYTARLVGRHADVTQQEMDVVGRHCEAGDVLVRGAQLPADLRAGDLLAVPVAGAYQLSVASGYNLVGRPALVAVRDGRARLLIRRETVEDFRAREVHPRTGPPRQGLGGPAWATAGVKAASRLPPGA
jgi:diaminopimelate decarboxylase